MNDSFYNKDKHKVFISYYHHDDQDYKNYIDKYLSGNIINKSVKEGDISTDNSTEYIKRLIREDYISDSSVVVVLVGSNTKTRKHVDWEIYAGLEASVNGNSGLVGIMLPELKYDNGWYYDDMPDRLADNIKSGYSKYYSWDYAKNNFDKIIEEAFNNRLLLKDKIKNCRIQMKHNTTNMY